MGDIAAACFDAILIHADTARVLSDEHFTASSGCGGCSQPPHDRNATVLAARGVHGETPARPDSATGVMMAVSTRSTAWKQTNMNVTFSAAC
jgi:hypothetical protein